METDWGLVIGLVSLICTIVLSLLAIGLGVYFYTQGKKTETHISTALGEIRQQTTALDKLTGRLLDRLSRAVTESARPEHEERRLLLLFQAVRQFTPDFQFQCGTLTAQTTCGACIHAGSDVRNPATEVAPSG